MDLPPTAFLAHPVNEMKSRTAATNEVNIFIFYSLFNNLLNP